MDKVYFAVAVFLLLFVVITVTSAPAQFVPAAVIAAIIITALFTD